MTFGFGDRLVAKKRGPGRPKKSAKETKDYALTIRGTGAWKDWLKRFADFCRRDMVGLVDEALESHAEKKGFEEKPPKR